MKKYLVADDCIERFLCKSMNIRDQFGKHILFQASELGNIMMKESIDFGFLCDSISKIKELATVGLENAEKTVDANSFREIDYKLYELLDFLNKPVEEDRDFLKMQEETKEFFRDLHEKRLKGDFGEHPTTDLNFEEMADKLNSMLYEVQGKDIPGE